MRASGAAPLSTSGRLQTPLASRTRHGTHAQVSILQKSGEHDSTPAMGHPERDYLADPQPAGQLGRPERADLKLEEKPVQRAREKEDEE